MDKEQQIKAAASYMKSLLKNGESVTVSVNVKDGICVHLDDQQNPTMFNLDEYSINPIGEMMKKLFENVCTDCMKEEWNFKNPFFLDLVEAYFHALVVTYGELVPITRTMAKAVLRYKLTSYQVAYASETNNMYFSVNDVEDLSERAYYLKAK